MEGAPPPLLELKDVEVVRDGAVLLRGVGMEVQPGTIHALAGPNGAGKSTLLGAILGALPFQGTIRFHFRGTGRIAVVPQRFHVDRTLPLSVLDFLALSRSRRPACLGAGARVRREVAALLGRVGLAGFERRALSALSGGEAQRVLLANALEPAPELLVLDEPTTGLDRDAQEWLEKTLGELRAQGVTVLMVSHDADQVGRLADRVTTLGGAA